MKKCGKCKLEKNIADFSKDKTKKDGLQVCCKLCKSEMKKNWVLKNKDYIFEYHKNYILNNPEKSLKYRKNQSKSEANKKYRIKNKEKIKEQTRLSKLKNKEKIKKTSTAYRIKNKEKIAAKRRKTINLRKSTNSLYKLTSTIRTAISNSLKRNGYSKKTRTFNILGCTFEEFKIHIELQFESWMTWEIHGLYNGELNYGWDLDHIIPLSSATTEEEVIKLNHYTNFQPLCSKVNRDLKRDNLL